MKDIRKWLSYIFNLFSYAAATSLCKYVQGCIKHCFWRGSVFSPIEASVALARDQNLKLWNRLCTFFFLFFFLSLSLMRGHVSRLKMVKVACLWAEFFNFFSKPSVFDWSVFSWIRREVKKKRRTKIHTGGLGTMEIDDDRLWWGLVG